MKLKLPYSWVKLNFMYLHRKLYEDILLFIKSNTHCFSLLTSLIRRPLRSRQASLLFVLSICAPMALSIEPNPIKINTNQYLISILYVLRKLLDKTQVRIILITNWAFEAGNGSDLMVNSGNDPYPTIYKY